MTEREFHHALSLGKPVFAFIVDDANTDLTPGLGEDDGSAEAQAKQNKLEEFIGRINTALVRERFKSPEDLKANVLASLSRLQGGYIGVDFFPGNRKTMKPHLSFFFAPFVSLSD